MPNDIFLEPVITSQCFHSFCANCISEAIQFESQCPLCRKKLKSDDIHANLALQSLVAELEVFCPFKSEGCTETMRYEALTNHVASACLCVPRKCVYEQYGCEFSGRTMTLNTHLESCLYHKLRAFIKTTDQRISYLEAIVVEQQQAIASLLAKDNVKPTGLRTVPVSSPVPSLSDGCSSSQDLRIAQHNWIENGMTCTKTIDTERSGVTSLAFRRGYRTRANARMLYAGSYDGSIKVFDSYSGNLKKSLLGHRLSVWNIDEDGTQPTATFGENHGKIYSLLVRKNRIFSASSDQTIRIWDAVSLEQVGVLSGHTGGVNSIKFYQDYILSASSDKSIKARLLVLTDSSCLHTVSHLPSECLDVAIGDGMLFASGYDSNITAYSANDYTRLGTMTGHRWEVWQLEYSNGVLFSGSHDHSIKIWDARNFQNASTLVGHRGYIHALAWGDGALLSGCADRSIKMWS
ncbi:hypothetical protein HDU91_006225 [Kappamyces sp. JEL0680]|nr:hypothetical protein HDU91_006225 [Kappamyces sp. JEL0680]